jgi:tetratricopeptide (TPR) repeat protein
MLICSALNIAAMKLKHLLILIAALATAFITQSFYASSPTKQAPVRWYRYPQVRASICVPLFSSADSAVEIPALKGWGNYKWKVSEATDSAQFYFNQGISMYYAFHSVEAIASFEKATRLDPQCAMAWYGKSLAMGPTINYPNGYAPPTGAYEASVKGKQLMAACTPLEKDLITAMQQRYSSDTGISVKQLRINYAGAMKQVYAKYPGNADVVTLYADALLLLHPWDLYNHDLSPKPWTAGIRSLLEKALSLSPKHPGANHYYIHTMEASATPQLALKSAHVLDTLMPLVSHVTHMPSHIYIRTGDYSRGINDNIAAVKGYHIYARQYSPATNWVVLYEFHNTHLKINCAQMGGDYRTSSTNSDSLQALVKPFLAAKENFIQYVYMQPALTNVRFGRWDDILKQKPTDTLAYADALLHFAKGLAWCGKGNVKMATDELGLMEAKMRDATLKIPVDNFSTAYEAAGVGRQILQGIIAQTRGYYPLAIALLQNAVATEDKLIYNEPRDWPIPARQYLANALLKAGKYPEAIIVLNKDLVINPNNGWALTGLQLAYQNTGNTAALAKTKQKLKKAWDIKDTEINRPVF